MIDHVSLAVADYARSRAFCEAALAPLGLVVAAEEPAPFSCGFGRGDRGIFWVGEGPTLSGAAVSGPLHIAFPAATRAEVDAFHKAALAAGGRDNGAPGLRPHYDPDYYAAFVFDPDGNNVEAVCRQPE